MSRWNNQHHAAPMLPGTILPGVPLAKFVPSAPSTVVEDEHAVAPIEAELVPAAGPVEREDVQHAGGRPAPIVDAEVIPTPRRPADDRPRRPKQTESATASTQRVQGPWRSPDSAAWPTTIPAWGQAPRGYGRALTGVPVHIAGGAATERNEQTRSLIGAIPV